MIVFALPQSSYLLPRDGEVHGVSVGRVAVERFANGERYVDLETDVDGRECAVVGALAPPDGQMLALLLLGDTLKRHGAAGVAALLPYVGYARQDRLEPGRSLAAAWIGALVAASGFREVVTVDVHSELARGLFPVPFASLSPAPLFAAQLEALALGDVTVVAPDEGAIARCRAVATAAGIESPVAFLEKRRTAEGVVHGDLVGEVGRTAVVVDDILDTGGTLVSCCRELRRRGVEDITVMVTHGLFTGERWEELWSHGVRRILCTDTVPQAAAVPPAGVTVFSTRPLLLQAMKARVSSA